MRKRNVCSWIGVMLAGVALVFGVKTVQAIDLGEMFSVSGYARTELDFHTGVRNPNNSDLLTDNYNVNLFRNTLLTEWVFKPSEQFKLFAKIRLVDDSTERIDSNLPNYNAFPTYKGDGASLRWRGNHDAAEVRELYADISIGKLWLRLGKQQIVWGESDGQRLLDVFNPLDLTQHLFLEPIPEQFENIRIPVWALRATYLVPNKYIDDLTLEGVFNPGDIVATQLADRGAPFNLIPALPPFIRVQDVDRRGDLSGGGRIYGKVGGVGFTLNYLYTYSQDGISRTKGLFKDSINGIPLLAPFGDFTPYSILVNSEHPKMNIYGASANYALAFLNAVIRAELTYTPDQPYQSRRDEREIIRAGTLRYVLGFERPTRILPLSITPSLASIGVQFFQSIRSGNERNLLINQAPVDKTDNSISLFISQSVLHDAITATFFFAYDFKGAQWIQPGLKYKPGNHWIFDVYANFLDGSDKRAYKLGALDFANGVFGRVTFQF